MSAAPGGFGRIAVVGTGLIGGSVALAAAGLGGVDVAVTDRDPRAREAAATRGLRVAEDLATAVADADLVVLATPVDVMPQVLDDVFQFAPAHAVITDVGSVKAPLLAALEGRPEVEVERFLGGHPMAGSEVGGLEGATATLFQGATWLLTPTARAGAIALPRVRELLAAFGARIVAVDPDTHDRLVAVVSHLPQLLASTLMALAGRTADQEPGLLGIAGGGFRDATRVAGSDPSIWRAIIAENRPAVLDVLARFVADLDDLRAAVERGDMPAVEALLVAGREARARIPGKAVAEPLVDLVIAVADRPGTLAEVTTALGVAGINIEDLAMRHDERRGRGALVVTVAASAVGPTLEVLQARGIEAHTEPR